MATPVDMKHHVTITIYSDMLYKLIIVTRNRVETIKWYIPYLMVTNYPYYDGVLRVRQSNQI